MADFRIGSSFLIRFTSSRLFYLENCSCVVLKWGTIGGDGLVCAIREEKEGILHVARCCFLSDSQPVYKDYMYTRQVAKRDWFIALHIPVVFIYKLILI